MDDIAKAKKRFSDLFFGAEHGVYAVCITKQGIRVCCSRTAAEWLPDTLHGVPIEKVAVG